MKKIVLTFAALVAFTFANAQETESTGFGFAGGDIMLEGNIGFSSTKDKNEPVTTTNTFDFNPKVGYFIADDFAVGVALGIGSDKTEVEMPGATTETKTTNFNAGVFGRYYFLDLGQRFKTYTELGIGMTSEKSETTGADEIKTNGFGAGLSLGINYFVTENIAINFTLADLLAYNTSKVDVDGAEAESTFTGNIGQFNNFFSTATFGVTFKF